MTTANALPRFEDCIALYRTAYEQFGTDPFTPEQIDVSGKRDRTLFELAVAYGLLSFDGTTYSVRCEPGASADRWERVVNDRVTRIQRAVSDRARTAGGPDTGGAADLTHRGAIYASAFVIAAAEFEAVVDTVERVVDRDHDGVVLRAPADLANEIQRFADRLCDGSAMAGTELPGPLCKESTDVVGGDKDDLEFRLFLSGP